MLKQLLEKMRERKAMSNEIEDNYRANKVAEQRRKSADERELERFMEEERQKQITNKVRQIRKSNTERAWRGENNILKEPNIFRNHHSILTDNPKMSIMGRSTWL